MAELRLILKVYRLYALNKIGTTFESGFLDLLVSVASKKNVDFSDARYQSADKLRCDDDCAETILLGSVVFPHTTLIF